MSEKLSQHPGSWGSRLFGKLTIRSTGYDRSLEGCERRLRRDQRTCSYNIFSINIFARGLSTPAYQTNPRYVNRHRSTEIEGQEQQGFNSKHTATSTTHSTAWLLGQLDSCRYCLLSPLIGASTPKRPVPTNAAAFSLHLRQRWDHGERFEHYAG